MIGGKFTSEVGSLAIEMWGRSEEIEAFLQRGEDAFVQGWGEAVEIEDRES